MLTANHTLHPASTPPLHSGVAAGERGRWVASILSRQEEES